MEEKQETIINENDQFIQGSFDYLGDDDVEHVESEDLYIKEAEDLLGIELNEKGKWTKRKDGDLIYITSIKEGDLKNLLDDDGYSDSAEALVDEAEKMSGKKMFISSAIKHGTKGIEIYFQIS